MSITLEEIKECFELDYPLKAGGNGNLKVRPIYFSYLAGDVICLNVQFILDMRAVGVVRAQQAE